MTDEEKTTQSEPAAPETPETLAEPEPETVAAESSEAEREEARASLNKEINGRSVVAGLAAATIVALVAVTVAGVFHLKTRLFPCPLDPPGHQPAAVLWGEIITDTGKPQSLGVSESLLQKTKFKTSAQEIRESDESQQKNR
ncbi:MAG TPA: hypothetical protein VK463_01610 [Desulfomonilaceae bacterium]|nr:hypothetical protein [Desulfomonilaceae bacterium]